MTDLEKTLWRWVAFNIEFAEFLGFGPSSNEPVEIPEKWNFDHNELVT